MTSFASSVFGPIAIIWLMASSTEIYDRLHRDFGMPSFTL